MLDSHGRTSPSHRQLPFWVSLLHLLADNNTRDNFFRAFASFWTDMDLEFSYISMLTYFLVIDNAEENTMHILRLPRPKCLAFLFCLKSKAISLPPPPPPPLSLSLPLSLFLIPSFFCFTVFFSILMSVNSLSLPHNHNIHTLLFLLTSDSNYHALMLSYITSNESCKKKITIALLLKCKKNK